MNIKQDYYSKDNLKVAFHYLKQEIDENSLSVDPIGRPTIEAIERLGDKFFSSLSEILQKGKYQPSDIDFMYAPKDNLGVRPISVIPIVDRIVYQALLNPYFLGKKIDKKIHDFAFGNRVLGKQTFLYPYAEKYEEFLNYQKKGFSKGYKFYVEIDLQGFYENILIEKLFEILKNDFSANEENINNLLKAILEKWSETQVSKLGLPQGPNASHILANAYLHPLDNHINELKDTDDFLFFRYVDDMVIMAKDHETVSKIATNLVIFLRHFNLRVNEKSKLQELKNVSIIEEKRFSNSYTGPSTSSTAKVNEFRHKIPNYLKKIKKGKEISKKDIGQIKYFLKASNRYEDVRLVDLLIETIPFKVSLTELIVRFTASHLHLTRGGNYKDKDEYIRLRSEKVWQIYKKHQLTEWSKYWLVKVLLFPEFYENNNEFKQEVLSVFKDKKYRYLRLIGLFYFAYISPEEDSSILFSIDDLKRYIKCAKNDIERSGYYYFLLYFEDKVDDIDIIKDIAIDGLKSISLEVQTICLYVLKKLSVKISKSNDYDLFAKLYLKCSDNENAYQNTQKITATTSQNDFFVFDGKVLIPKEQFEKFMGLSHRKNNGKFDKKIKKITFVRANERSQCQSCYVNEDLEDKINIQRNSGPLKELIKLGFNESVSYTKQTMDYLNSNKKCVLYRTGRYILTNIVRNDAGVLAINRSVKIEIITEATLQKRKNKKVSA
ncbi:hypothetical protein IT397_03620 [Candidatus Nomurabacteria bacterium]|nr:hypothetical protein [Candidatus Nomurabacteria bacterium]